MPQTRPAPATSQRRFQVRKALVHGVLGFGLGLLVLHPLAMAMFAWLGVHSEPVSGSLGSDLVWSSFTVGIFPMGAVFGVFTAVIAATDGFYRASVHFQRDELARLLAVNEEFRNELVAQNERLRELETEKRRSTHFLVHDLKNHLGCVLGFSELLFARATSAGRDRDREDLERVLRQGRQMLGEVVDLLDLARVEEAPSLDLDEHDVYSLLAEALAAVDIPSVDGRIHLGERHLRCAPAWCDRRLVVRMLVNLATNALKHNSHRTHVTLDAAFDDGELIFSCTDDGAGISAEPVPRLFDEFVTESELASDYASGLGLAFCRAAGEAHGGRIWCESSPGEGTTFRFAVPTRPELEANTGGFGVDTGRHDNGNNGLQQGDVDMEVTENTLGSVLVVGDDEDYAALLATVLQDGGYDVRVAYDGRKR